MRKLIASPGIAVCLVLALATGCSDKSSPEACQYATTKNLDKGNYDAVLQSPCATPMHLGAAYFGKAGYTVTSVINTLITVQTTTLSADTALRQYLGPLTGKVTDSTINYLDNSRAKYLGVPPSSDLYSEAQFDLSIVDAIKAVALIKSVIDSAGLGTLSSCDNNNNGIPDEADALACALLVSGTTPTSGPCPGVLTSLATYSAGPLDLTFSSATGTFGGLVTTMTGSGTCPADYKRLLYLNTDGKYYAAATAGTCQANDGSTWPCPVTSGIDIDLVAALGTSINSSVSALNTAITASTEVKQAIEDIKTQACGGSLVSTCTATTIADYLQTHL